MLSWHWGGQDYHYLCNNSSAEFQEWRKAYVDSPVTQKDLVNVIDSAKEALKDVVAEKMRLFGLVGKTWSTRFIFARINGDYQLTAC